MARSCAAVALGEARFFDLFEGFFFPFVPLVAIAPGMYSPARTTATRARAWRGTSSRCSNSSEPFFGTDTHATSYDVGHLDDAIARLQRDVSLERLVAGRGVKPSRSGTGTCPFHPKSKPATLTVNPKTNTWTCPRCKVTNAGVVEWTMKAEGISKRHAVEFLQADSGTGGGKIVKHSTTTNIAHGFDGADHASLLGQVVAYYADTLKRSPKALDFLKAHGITGEAVEHFKIGMCDRTLGYRIPKANRKGGAELRGRLQGLGIYRDTGHEVLRGCITIPVVCDNGAVSSLLGRRVDSRGVEEPNVYTGTPGLFNREAFSSSREIVVCSSPWEALLAWSCGIRNVTAIHGLDGDLDELLDATGSKVSSKVTLLFPHTPEGEKAISNIKDRLKGVEVFRALLPTGMNVESYVTSQGGPDRLLEVVRAAEWIGGVKPRETKPALPRIVVEGSPQSAAPTTPTSARLDEITIEHGDRRWRVRGLSSNTSYERLRVHLFVSRETRDPRTSGFFVDALDLYSARHRNSYVEQAAQELGLDADVVKRDLGHVLLHLEARQDEQYPRRPPDARTPANGRARSPVPACYPLGPKRYQRRRPSK